MPCIDHNFLFEPCMLTARGWVNAGRTAHVLAADVFYGVDPLRDSRARRLRMVAGRPLQDVLPHAIYRAPLPGDRAVAARRTEPRAGRTWA